MLVLKLYTGKVHRGSFYAAIVGLCGFRFMFILAPINSPLVCEYFLFRTEERHKKRTKVKKIYCWQQINLNADLFRTPEGDRHCNCSQEQKGIGRTETMSPQNSIGAFREKEILFIFYLTLFSSKTASCVQKAIWKPLDLSKPQFYQLLNGLV